MKLKLLKNGLPFDGRDLKMEDKLSLEVQLFDQFKIVVRVDHQKNIHILKPIRSDNKDSVYRLEIATQLTYVDGVPFIYTKYPQNNLRIVARDGRNIVMTEIAVVAHYGELFITEQEVRREEIGLDWGTLVVPELNWPALDKLINEDTAGARKLGITKPEQNLRPVHKIPTKPEVKIPKLGNNQAFVLWYNRAMGWGTVMTKIGQARIHWHNTPINKLDGMRGLDGGELLEFPRLKEINSPNTKFRLEIVGEVKVIELPKEEKPDLPLKTEDRKPLPEKEAPATA
jgi:cold shock CspA family protein